MESSFQPDETSPLLFKPVQSNLDSSQLERSSFNAWLKQIKILLYKNFLLIKTDWSWLILLLPIILVAALFGLDHATKPNTHSNLSPSIKPFPTFKPLSGHSIPVGWAPQNVSPKVTEIMNIFAEQNNFSIHSYPTEESLISAKIKNSPKIQTGIIWQNDTISDFSYKIYFTDDSDVSKLQFLVDRAILSQASSNRKLKMPLFYRNYPTVYVDIGQPTDITTQLGPLIFIFPPLILTFIGLYKIVNEKEKLLRLGMNLMGLKDSAFWLSWFITMQIFNIILAILLICSGMAFQFDFFLRCDFIVLFVVFFEFGTSMIIMGFFISTILHKTSSASNAGWAILLLSLVLQAVLFSSIFIVYALYSDIWWLEMIRYLFQTFYPPFNFSKAFLDISQRTAPVYDKEKGKYVHGPGFKWSNLYDEPKVDFGLDINVPSTDKVLWYMFGQIIFWIVVTLYLDNIIPSPNGPGKPIYYFLKPSYWGFHQFEFFDMPPAINPTIAQDPDVIQEIRRTLETRPDDPKIAMRILGLGKIYYNNPFFSTSKDLRAVDNLYLTIFNGECFCFLGHNGAGKTTTINMLNGLYEPSEGTAEIYGLDIRRDMTALRRMLGVCPQHDILWPDLTARQHLTLFAEFKGVPRSMIDSVVDEKLSEVGLYDVGDNASKSFSGGMKRRLSVAISSIGNPKVIFMDEPTTGLDPLSKRAVWDLIQNLKKDRCIILTTHSLEEADILADRLSIMSFGRFRCLGSSLHLKNRYGDGYRINFVVAQENIESLKQFVASLVPSTILSESVGNITFKVPLENVQELSNLCEKVEMRQGPPIVDFGISHTTLEDVFIKVTEESNFVYQPLINSPIQQ